MTTPRRGAQQFVERRAGRVRRVPSVFLAHGSPMSVLDKPFGTAIHKFLTRQKRLRAIVIVSAHWQTTGEIRITSSPQPKLIYDFMGFPDWVYQLTYPCPGDRSVAQAVAILLDRQGLSARLDPDRGLDHGVWIPLSLAMPDARTPVVQVSLPYGARPEVLVSMGRALSSLRAEDICLMGSGGLVHNLGRVDMGAPDNTVEPWADAFDQWAYERALRLDVDALANYAATAPHAAAAVPTSEHFDPLFFVMGTALPSDSLFDLFAGFRYGTLSMRSFALVGRRREDRGF